jgi:AcrR family transcriptional regulator
MPATRPHIDRDVKKGEILDAAEKLLLRDGYDATTMAAIAREAGVANNAVYWYFPSKDDVLASVLERRLTLVLANLADSPSAGFEEQVRSLLAELDEVAKLTAAVHERSKHSAAVSEMHRRFHREADRYLTTSFRDAGLNRADAGRAAAAIMAMVEGVHLHEPDRDSAARDHLVLWALGRMTAHVARDRVGPRS